MAKVALLLSGGMESVTLLHELVRASGSSVTAIVIEAGLENDYHQLHYAKKHCIEKRVLFEIVDMSGIQKLMAGFVRPDVAILEWDVKCPWDSMIPVAIGVSVFRCQLEQIDELVVGLTKEQARVTTAQYLSQIGQVHALFESVTRPVQVSAPFLGRTKGDVVKLGVSLGVDFDETWSCLHGGPAHCGRCSSCIDRKAAFVAAQVPDPTTYLP